jgi:predicted metal-binding membrane protein
VTGKAHALHHDALIEGAPPLWAALLLFLVAWQAMIAAMMLPSSLPLIRLFEVTSRSQEHVRRVRVAFLAGYTAIWTAFGAAAFLGDVAVHRTVDATPWLSERQWLIGGTTLALAGAFQFSELKDKCLSKCRHPAPYLLGHYRRGMGGAFRLGSGHGIFCLGCCWALMLVMFAAGVAMLWWMARTDRGDGLREDRALRSHPDSAGGCHAAGARSSRIRPSAVVPDAVHALRR